MLTGAVITRRLGQGYYGSVFEAQLVGGKTVAIKTQLLISSEGIQSSAVLEADALNKLRDTSAAIRLEGLVVERCQIKLILQPMTCNLVEYTQRLSLENRKLMFDYFLRSMLSALVTLEGIGIQHFDIKPSNILVGPGTTFGCQFKLADFGKCTYVTDPYCKYSAIARYRPYYNNTVFMEELYAFCVVLVETIIGENMIHCPDDLEEETIRGFYREYGRKQFDIRRFLKDTLPRSQYKQIPDIFWDYVDPIFTFRDVTGVKLLKQVGLEISKDTMSSVKNAVSSESRLHPNLEIVRAKAHRIISRVDPRRAKRISDLYDRLMSKFLYTPEGMAVDRIREYSEIALIILLNKRYIRNRQNIFVNEEQLLLFQRSMIIALEYQTIVLP